MNSEFNTIELVTGSGEPDYKSTRTLADAEAGSRLSSPILVAPYVPECQHKPGWISYAEGHGGSLRININKGFYSFIYADMNDVP